MTPIAWHTGPIPSLENTIKEKDWFKGIVLSATMLERYGCLMLKEQFASKQTKVDEQLERLHLKEIALFLYGLQKIDETHYEIMLMVNHERNKAVHQTKDRTFFVTREADKKYEPLIRKAIECLKVLGAKKIFIMK